MWGTRMVFHTNLGEPLAEIPAVANWQLASEFGKILQKIRAKLFHFPQLTPG
jgi:hypothetical protein